MLGYDRLIVLQVKLLRGVFSTHLEVIIHLCNYMISSYNVLFWHAYAWFSGILDSYGIDLQQQRWYWSRR